MNSLAISRPWYEAKTARISAGLCLATSGDQRLSSIESVLKVAYPAVAAPPVMAAASAYMRKFHGLLSAPAAGGTEEGGENNGGDDLQKGSAKGLPVHT
nr:hypothetical protein Itr_chr11CG00880 [Ipomoea trifida]